MNNLRVKNCGYALNFDGLKDLLPSKNLRRTDDLTKLSLYCAAKVLLSQNIDLEIDKEDIGLIIATPSGPIKQVCAFMDSIIDDGEILASPLSFSYSVHNAIEAQISALLNFKGPCLTISQGAQSFFSASISAKSWLLDGRCSAVLLGAVDETNPILLKTQPEKIIFQSCAAFFLLTLNDGKELKIENPTFDEFNPCLDAFNAARKYAPLLDEKDVEKISADFAKTHLAARKIKVMNVFENNNPKETLAFADEKQRTEIFGGLKTFFSIDEDAPLHSDNLIQAALKSLSLNEKIIFSTSGSSGKPALSPHCSDMIKEEVRGISSCFGNLKRVISIVPAHHSYGFIFGLMLPKFLDISAIYQAPIPDNRWNSLLKEGDLLIAFPLFLRYLKDMDFKFPNISILTSTAPCPDDLLDYALKNGAKDITEIYGSSESGAIAFRKAAASPFALLPFWNYKNTDGRDMIFRKETSFEMELPDIVRFADERSFFVEGRKDKAVQIAGINVYPSKVERIIKTHPCIKDISVRLGGERLKAFIVLNDGADLEAAKKDLRKFMNENLLAHEIPQNIEFGDALPSNPWGKKADWNENEKSNS